MHILIGGLFTHYHLFAIHYKLDSGSVSIKLPAPMGDIQAVNNMISGLIDEKSGAVEVHVSVEGFQFVTPFMPDYINEETTRRFRSYYLETDQFPDAFFRGKILDMQKVNFNKDGMYPVQAKGVITIHGVAQDISNDAIILVKEGQITLKTSFMVHIKDHQIRVPEVLQNIFFKKANVEVECRLR